jgi:hypothetical protein
MATMVVTEGTALGAATVRRLAREAVALNLRLGDPTLAARRAGAAAKRPAPEKRSSGRRPARSGRATVGRRPA